MRIIIEISISYIGTELIAILANIAIGDVKGIYEQISIAALFISPALIENITTINAIIKANVSGRTAVDTSSIFDIVDPIAPYRNANIKNVSDSDFEMVLGRPIPCGNWSGEIEENDAFCQLYYAKSPVARLLYKILTSLKDKSEAKGKPDLNILFIYNMPFRAVAKMSIGLVSKKMTEDIVFIMNGHFWRGLGRLIVDFVKNLINSAKFNNTLKNLETNSKG